MTLAPAKSSGEKAEAHDDSDQVLLLLEGELIGEVGDEHLSLRRGDVIMIPSGAKHRFTNRGAEAGGNF
jgi:mannose-6-phosphate isomerase-like protein (cupin superfamily)